MDEGDLRKLITSYLFYCTSCAEQFKSTSSEAGRSSKCNLHFSSSAKSDIFATKYKVVYNISDELNFCEEPGFDPSSSNWGAGEKKTCQKLDFLVQNPPLFERFQENRSHSILNNFDISTTFAGVEKLSDNFG